MKVFGHDGMKLADAIELEIEKELAEARDEAFDVASFALPGESEDLVERYEQFLVDGAARERSRE